MSFRETSQLDTKSEVLEQGGSEDTEITMQPHGGSDNDKGNRQLVPPTGRSQSLYDSIQETPRRPSHLEPLRYHPSQRSQTNAFGSVLNTLKYAKPFRHGERRMSRLNTQLLEAVKMQHLGEVQRLLGLGSNPNASCHVDMVSACHLAALMGGPILSLLLKAGAEKLRIDRLGRTPLHFAAWAGNVAEIGILLEFPEDLQRRLANDCESPELMDEIKKFCVEVDGIINVRCGIETKAVVPSAWSDNIEHNCKALEKHEPYIQPGWTPLHAASANARHQCVAVLLAAGADPNLRDYIGRTALDVVGSAYYNKHAIEAHHFAETIRTILHSDKLATPIFAQNNIVRRNLDTPLHTAVHLKSLDAIQELLDAGASYSYLNRAGDTPLHVCIKEELKEHLQLLANYNYEELHVLPVDLRDKDGYTVLHRAIFHSWRPGVCVCLEAGADVTLKANNGKSPIHTAAALGDECILNEILSITKNRQAIDFRNQHGETALFTAIKNKHLECVKLILKYGADIQVTLPKNVNVFHIAAERGLYGILKVLLDHDYTITRYMINVLTTNDGQGYGPIHFAVLNNHEACVKLLLSKNAYVNLKTSSSISKSSTPLHMAAQTNNVEIAKILLRFDEKAIYNIDDMGWLPLHVACHNASKRVIILLLSKGADLSSLTNGDNNVNRTAIQMIVDNLPQPTKFLEEIFDSCIKISSSSIQDPNYTIKIDYSLLVPSNGADRNQQMRVIEALIETGNTYNQRKLLLHPYIESFLFLKWQMLLYFFYTIIAFYGMFVGSLTAYILSEFFCRDTNIYPTWFDPSIWKYFVYVTAVLIISQEMLLMDLGKNYLCQVETWVKAACATLAVVLPSVIPQAPTEEWPRHIATLALLLAWFEMTILLSRFPRWGFYVLMFAKVSSKVIKILLTFGFLLIGFALSFMIQLHSERPFDGPWAAFVKTIVMMTSEFDYDGLIKNSKATLLCTRLIFLLFLILAAIVLMNLMVGVAVNDVNNLEVLGNIRRLEKHVEFLRSLDTLAYHRIFKKIAPNVIKNTLSNIRKMNNIIELKPNASKDNSYLSKFPPHIRDGIVVKVMQDIKHTDEINHSQYFVSKIDQICDRVTSIHKLIENPKCQAQNENAQIRNIVNAAMLDLRNELTVKIKELQSPFEELNNKMNLILRRLDKLDRL